MVKTIQLKNPKLLYLYWAVVLATGAVALIVTLTVESVSVARIINLVCFIVFLLAFFGGYIDFKNYKPLKSVPKALYIAAGMISLSLILFHLNVENYNTLSSVDLFNDYYSPIASAFVSLQLAIGIIGACLAIINHRDKHFQTRVFYAIAISSIISAVMMTFFNFSTNIILFRGVFGVFGFGGMLLDIGLTTLIVRVLLEYSIFITHSIHKKKHISSFEGRHIRDEVEFEPIMVRLAKIGFWLMLAHVVVLRIIKWFSGMFSEYSNGFFIAYEVIEIVSAIGIVVVGILMCLRCKKNMTYGQIYRRMGLAAVIFGAVYLVMDFAPITLLFPDSTQAQGIVITDIFQSIVKTVGLIIYSGYVMFNKKLKEQIDIIEKERHETVILA